MTSRVLHPLNCSKCGAALPAAENQRILVCPYCGQSHAFVPPPLERGASSPTRPTSRSLKVAVLAASVVVVGAIAAAAALARRESGSLATVSVETGPGDPAAAYAVAQAVDIHWGGTFWPGVVTAKDGDKYRVHYDGYASSSDEWVTARRLRPRVAPAATTEARDAPARPDSPARAPEADAGDPNATYTEGELVDIHWGSRWWPGSIEKRDDRRYRITYEGYGSSWDEWVTAERLRPRAKGR